MIDLTNNINLTIYFPMGGENRIHHPFSKTFTQYNAIFELVFTKKTSEH